MKKITQNSPIFALLIAVVFSVFYGCEKNPIDNFKITVSPALFSYSAFLRIIDAADSTVPPNLKIVLDPENEGYLYDILGKNKLEISKGGYISVGLKPSIKPDAANPVVIRFQLQADNYISETYNLVFYEDEFLVEETYALTNKNNLPEGVFYTEFETELVDGSNAKDIVIELGGGSEGNHLKSTAGFQYSSITVEAGSKWYYKKGSEKIEWKETGKISVFSHLSFYSRTIMDPLSKRSVKKNGVISIIGENTRMANNGILNSYFMANGKVIYPSLGATFQLVLPKWGLNLKTGNLFQKGDLIDVYNFNFQTISKSVYELVSSQTLTESNDGDTDPNWLRLGFLKLENYDQLCIGEILPIVFPNNPKIGIQGDNSTPGNSNVSKIIDQFLFREYKYNGKTYLYDFASYSSGINCIDKRPMMPIISQTYKKKIDYRWSILNKNTGYLSSNWERKIIDNVIVGQGQPNPYDFTFPSGKFELTNLSFSVKCGDKVINPTFYFVAYARFGPDGNWSPYEYNGENGFVINGKASSYLLKVGGTYKFVVNYEGKTFEGEYKITSANTEIVIEDDRLCNF